MCIHFWWETYFDSFIHINDFIYGPTFVIVFGYLYTFNRGLKYHRHHVILSCDTH